MVFFTSIVLIYILLLGGETKGSLVSLQTTHFDGVLKSSGVSNYNSRLATVATVFFTFTNAESLRVCCDCKMAANNKTCISTKLVQPLLCKLFGFKRKIINKAF